MSWEVLVMKYLILMFALLLPGIAFSKVEVESRLSSDGLVKLFNDVCFENRSRLNKIPLLAESLGWQKSGEEYLGMQFYSYQKYTIVTKSDFAYESCVINTSNEENLYDFELVEHLKKLYPPISNVLNGQQIALREGLPSSIAGRECSTHYKRSWFIEGGYEITVNLIDEHNIKRVALKILRF